MKAFEKSSSQSKIMYLFIFCLAGLFLAGSLVTVISGFVGAEMLQSAWGLRISSAIQMILMFFMPALTLVIWSNYKPSVFLELNRRNSDIVKLTFFSIAILVLAMPFISLVAKLNEMLILPEWMSGIEVWMQELEQSAEETTELLLSGKSIVDYLSNLFFIAVIASIAEEVFFRGVLQQLLSKHFNNEHVGVWLTAIVFSLMHLQFYGFLPRVMLGAMLGYLFVFTRNLWIPILIHFLNNALVVTFNFFLRDNALYKVIEDPSFNTPFVLLGISSLFLTVCAYLMLEPDPMYPTED